LKKTSYFILFFTALFVLSCNDNVYKQGERYYLGYCSNCHGENGEGLRGLIPPLAKSDYLSKNRANLACLIRIGQKGPIMVNGVGYGQQEMPAIAKLTDFEITNIFNYIGTSWGNTEKLWTVEEIREGLKQCQ
jgi:mono/diheme cytochrome c family protein